MYYKACKRNESRTTYYVGSTNNPYDADVEEVRKDIARNNAEITANFKMYGKPYGEFQKLRVRPRGPRRPYAHDTKIKDALYFDIYRASDTSRTYNMIHGTK
jgi:hypothetical protein